MATMARQRMTAAEAYEAKRLHQYASQEASPVPDRPDVRDYLPATRAELRGNAKRVSPFRAAPATAVPALVIRRSVQRMGAAMRPERSPAGLFQVFEDLVGGDLPGRCACGITTASVCVICRRRVCGVCAVRREVEGRRRRAHAACAPDRRRIGPPVVETLERATEAPGAGATIAENDLQSADRLIGLREWKAAVLVGGSALEALVLALVERHEAEAQAFTARMLARSKRRRDEGARWDQPLNKLGLYGLVTVAGELGILSPDAVDTCHRARRARNAIHPGDGAVGRVEALAVRDAAQAALEALRGLRAAAMEARS